MSVLIMLGLAVLCLFISAILGFLTLFYIFPHYLLELGFAIQRYQLGMKLKYVRNGESVFCYAERNSFREDKPTLVFLHGFTTSCNQWIYTFQKLKTDRHMLAVDLPGHGRSSIPSRDEFNPEGMVNIICNLLDSVGLKDKKIHLIGNSLGGALSGIFAAHHPDRVAKVTMICPAMQTPIENDFAMELKNMVEMDPNEVSHKHCRLLPQDVPGLRAMFDCCTYATEKLKFHDQIYQGLLALRLRKNEFFLDLLKIMNNQENLQLLASMAPSITMPSQIIWGKYDEIISSSGAEYLKSLLPDCRRIDVLDRSGHCIDMDRPYAFCKVLSAFIEDDGKKEA